MHTNKQLFFSHTWRYDEQNRNTHNRVKYIGELMHQMGWSIWLDEDNMSGNMDSVMVNGIRNCQVVIICLTAAYIKKVNRASEDGITRDNCYKEWTFSNNVQKRMLPIILEPAVINMIDKGVIDLFLGNTFYIDLSDINNKSIKALNEAILRFNIQPHYRSITGPSQKLTPRIQLKSIVNLLTKSKEEEKQISTPVLIYDERSVLPTINSQKEIRKSHISIGDSFNCVVINSIRKKWGPSNKILKQIT